ncbi:MAG: hypothetical protein MJE63_17760 [Proteobacteria bacterium]|nr:hypothetical protein [Pseudomonadota bacterium]
MKIRHLFILIAIVSLIASGCGKTKPKQIPVTEEEFLTLADIGGRTTFREDSPDVRVIKVKAKALIKKNDIRLAKRNALENAGKIAVESMVRELMTSDDYNRRYEEIERYFSKNIDKYIVDREIVGERKIYNDRYYGISAAFKVSRQKTLVALQKDLRFIDASGSTLITVITSKKGLDLSAAGYKFQDIEDMLMNQVQTDLNQRGLRAMDFRNAVTAMQSDERKRKQFAKLSKEQFMTMVAGSSAGEAAFNKQLKEAEEYYSTGLTLLKQLAKVVVEINILSVDRTDKALVLGVNVTAKNISTATGGAFANETFNVARRTGPNTSSAAMITELVRDTYQEMKTRFIPQVIKEMSTVDVTGDKLIRYELVMKGFDGPEFRKVRRAVERAQTDKFRYIDYDNTLKAAKPSINIMFVRYAGRLSALADIVMDTLDDAKLPADDPIVARDVTDLVFERLKKK